MVWLLNNTWFLSSQIDQNMENGVNSHKMAYVFMRKKGHSSIKLRMLFGQHHCKPSLSITVVSKRQGIAHKSIRCATVSTSSPNIPHKPPFSMATPRTIRLDLVAIRFSINCQKNCTTFVGAILRTLYEMDQEGKAKTLDSARDRATLKYTILTHPLSKLICPLCCWV